MKRTRMASYPTCRSGCGWLGIAVLVGSTGCMPDGVLLTPVSMNRELREKVVSREGAWTSHKVVVIDVAGMLLNAHTPGLFSEGEHPVGLLIEQLDMARRDNAVKGVVLRINSPGGTVGASEIMYDEITRFRDKTGKPVVASLMDVAASGGYYVACACDEIIAQHSTVTGSIGVILQMFDLSGTMSKLGITSNAITSGPRKDSGSPFRPMSELDRAIFQSLVDEFYSQFITVVAKGRANLNEDQVRTLADGRVYSAEQALDNGLVDRLGGMRDAISEVKQRAGIQKTLVVRYHRPLGYVANYHAAAPGSAGGPFGRSGGDVNMIKIDAPGLTSLSTPNFLYLWSPGAM